MSFHVPYSGVRGKDILLICPPQIAALSESSSAARADRTGLTTEKSSDVLNWLHWRNYEEFLSITKVFPKLPACCAANYLVRLPLLSFSIVYALPRWRRRFASCSAFRLFEWIPLLSFADRFVLRLLASTGSPLPS